jgi:hypothetical protein
MSARIAVSEECVCVRGWGGCFFSVGGRTRACTILVLFFWRTRIQHTKKP